MEIKKLPSVDLENKKGLFLQIGLVLSLLFVIAMFSWSQREIVIQDLSGPKQFIEQEMIDNTVQEKPKEIPTVQAVKATADLVEIVKNDAVIVQDLDFSDFSDEPIQIIQPPAREEVARPENIPMLRVEKMPSFQGGDLNTFRDWVQKNVVYPEMAQANNIQGTVTLTFVVNTAGEVVDVEIVSSPDKLLSDAALKAVRSSPKWTPGMQSNRPQAVKMSIPVQFVLR